ncbi:hypothetical protein EB093_03895 [bacterium]|nr:hypothetical protein [bacterium]
MFGVGTPEFLLIAFIAVLVVKPEDVPKLMRRFGEIYGRVLRAYHAFLDELDSLDEVVKK